MVLLLILIAPTSMLALSPGGRVGASSSVVNQGTAQDHPHPGFEKVGGEASNQAGSSTDVGRSVLEHVSSHEDTTLRTAPSHLVIVKSLVSQSDSSLVVERGDILPLGGPPPSYQGVAASDEGRAPAMASSSPRLPQLNALTGFSGLIYGVDGSYVNHSYPPDVSMAVGPSHVMELVNVVGEIWTKQGTSLSTFSLATFFGLSASDHVGDSKVLYDSSSSRWFASTDDFTTGAVTVGVSQSNDPTGRWTFWTFTPTSSYCPDQPMLGVNDDKVAISVNDYNSCSNLASNNYVGVEYWVINKSQMLAGGTISYSQHLPDSSIFSLHPVQSLSSTSTLYMVSVWGGNSGVVRLWSVTGIPTSTTGTSYSYSDITISLTSAPPSAPQKGSTYLLDSGDARVQDTLWNQGMLWFTFDDGCTPSGDTQVRSCIRLTQLDTTSKTVKQDSDVAAAGQYYLYAALRLDSQGDAVIVLGYSSVNSYPGILVLSQVSGSTPNSYSAPSILQAGSGPEALGGAACTSGVCRYGDYFGASTDPSSPSVVWVAGEYGTPSGWATFISSLSLSLHLVPLTVSYSIQGAGSGYSSPVLTYIAGGQQITAVLGTTPTSYSADSGSSWAVTNPLSGSSSSERWQTSQTTSGTVSTSVTQTFVYYHQYLVSSSYSIVGSGKPNPPALSYSSFGSNSLLTLATSQQGPWIDAGSTYVSTNPLIGSTANERWFSTENNGTVSSSGTLSFSYHHQYLLTFIGRGTSSIFLDEGFQQTISISAISRFANGTGYRISALTIDSGAAQTEPLTKGNLSIPITMNAPHTYVFTIVNQYQVGLDAAATQALNSITPPTITGDSGWYDSGTAVTVSFGHVWNLVAGQSRLAAVGYSTDSGAVTPVAEAGSGTFDVSLSMSSPHTVGVEAVTQYYLTFHFADATGSKTITPTALQITVGGKAQDVPGFAAFLDDGTAFTVSQVLYGGVDVKPAAAAQYSVTAPATITLNDSVYDATVKVSDLLGLAVSGAQVEMTLVNGTVVSGTTGGDGTFTASKIPLGTFTASVSSFGSSAQVTGDASKQSVTPASVLFGTTSLGIVVAVIVVAALAAVFMLRRRSGARR